MQNCNQRLKHAKLLPTSKYSINEDVMNFDSKDLQHKEPRLDESTLILRQNFTRIIFLKSKAVHEKNNNKKGRDKGSVNPLLPLCT